MRNTAVPEDLASSRSREAHSRTCETEPADDSRAGRVRVWIESMISRRGFTWATCSSTRSRFVSVTRNSSSGKDGEAPAPWFARRTARILIWRTDSSPETYKTEAWRAISSATCNSKVDLPIPGSPPISTIDPGTTPPPRTRANSPIPGGRRSSSSPPISARRCGWAEPPDKRSAGLARGEVLERRSLRPCCSRLHIGGSAPYP